MNATFDVALARELACLVYSFDPTPTAVEYMRSLEYDRDTVRFYPYGVWSDEKTLRFYTSVTPGSANFSVSDIHGTGHYVEGECKRLSTIMAELGHERLDLLKLDIEGSWYEVLRNILNEGVRVSVLCVEFDTPTSLGRIRQMTRWLGAAGFELVHYERENYVFRHKQGATS